MDTTNHTPGGTPNDPMEHAQRRLTELEIKASFTEDLLDRLNDIVINQQARLDALARELAALRAQMPAGDSPQFRSLRDELPPHY